MSAARRTKDPVALGLRALRGGSVVVGVALKKDEPRVVLSSFLATGEDNDRLSLEPYHVAAEMERAPNGGPTAAAAAAVAKGRKRQEALAAKGLESIALELRRDGYEPVTAALLINRAGWIADLLAYSLAWAEHAPVAEGLAVREALRFAINKLGLALVELDEKSLPDAASNVLAVSNLELRLKSLGATAGKPWRKEQKLACLAAWYVLATSG